MAYLNQAQIIGNLGRDPEIKATATGTNICNFSVATSKKWNKDGEQKEQTTWHNITAFGKLADLCQQYLKKGSSVYLSGEMRQDSWEDDSGQKKYKNYIALNEVQFLSRSEAKSEEIKPQQAQEKPKGPAKSLSEEKGVKNYAPQSEPPKVDDKEELPF